jgi:hypothetical protein
MGMDKKEIKLCSKWTAILVLPVTGVGLLLAKASHSAGLLGLLAAFLALPGFIAVYPVQDALPAWLAGVFFVLVQTLYVFFVVVAVRAADRQIKRLR